MSYPHPEPWKSVVLFSRGFSPLGQQPGPPPCSSPEGWAPCERVAGLDLAHVHPHTTPPVPFLPKHLCVYQTDLTLSASQESRSQFLFHVYGLRAGKYKWMVSRAYRKTELQQPAQETHPLSARVSPGCQPAVSKTGLCQTTISSNNPENRTITPVIIIPKWSGLNNWRLP